MNTPVTDATRAQVAARACRAATDAAVGAFPCTAVLVLVSANDAEPGAYHVTVAYDSDVDAATAGAILRHAADAQDAVPPIDASVN